jgi:snurportin-1
VSVRSSSRNVKHYFLILLFWDNQRRATRIDSGRNLSNFAQLSLADDIDEKDEDEPSSSPSTKRGPHGIAAFASLLEKESPVDVDVDANSMASSSTGAPPTPVDPSSSGLPTTFGSTSTGSKRKHQRKRRSKNKVNRWADKCMYAELLEMHEDWAPDAPGDGIPDDLETGWIAVPVPRGKRCLAVTYQGLSKGMCPLPLEITQALNYLLGPASPSSLLNLHSRLLGKQIMAPFPCNLPPDTVLDCILDSNWKHQETSSGNSILHVLDVLRWNGRDVGSCEAGFR